MLTFDLKQFRASHGLATSYYKTKASYFLLSSTNFHISIIYYKKKISFFFSLSLQSSFTQSLLSSCCPYLFLSFVFSRLKHKAFFMNEKKKKSWNGNVDMWLKSPKDVKVVQIQKLPWNMYGFFIPKKKKNAPQTLNIKSLQQFLISQNEMIKLELLCCGKLVAFLFRSPYFSICMKSCISSIKLQFWCLFNFHHIRHLLCKSGG